MSEYPYKLFLSIPRLIKYYYPEVKRLLKYKKMLKNKKQDDENPENNFELEQLDFEAFLFKFMLNPNLQTAGTLEW